MRSWTYITPTSDTDMTPVPHTYTEDQIFEEYFVYWANELCKQGKTVQISRQRCIDDWVAVNWAEPGDWTKENK